MKYLFNKYERKIVYVMWCAMFAAFILLVAATTKHHVTNKCEDVLVNIHRVSTNKFLNQKDVIHQVQLQTGIELEGRIIYDVDLQLIENEVEHMPFVKSSDIYFDNNGLLTFNLHERHPLIRVVNKNNVSYYIDNEGNKFPVSSKFTARVPIVSGHIADNDLTSGEVSTTIGKAIYQLASFIADDPFWFAFVEQIYVAPNNQFVLIPKWGDYEIELGTIDDIEKKFKKLESFLADGMEQDDWTNYKTINLKYNKQIVCSLKNTNT